MNIPVEILLPKKIPRQSRSAILVQSVFEACEEMLLNGWSPHSSLAPLIDKVGICNSSLYQYFHTKEGIFIATYEYMLKKILLRADWSQQTKDREIEIIHEKLRRIDEPFYFAMMELRQHDEQYRAFYVNKDGESKNFLHARRLGYWGDGDRLTPKANLMVASRCRQPLTSRLSYAKPINMASLQASMVS
jgi:AcrR family transcriptional regulator